MVTKFHHFAITLGSLATDGSLYEDLSKVLGCDFRKHSSSIWALLPKEGPELLLYQAKVEGQHTMYSPGYHHLCFRVDSRELVEQAHSTATSHNCKILDAPKEYPHYAEGYYAVFFQDGSGLKLEVAHIPNDTH